MIIIVSGEDSFRSRRRLAALIDAFKKKFDPKGYNIVRCDGPSVSFDEVQNAFGTISFLASKRMLVFENFFTAKMSEKQKQICTYLVERDSENHIIVFWQDGDLPGVSSRLTIVKKAKAEQFDSLDGSSLAAWIRTEAAARHITLEQAAGRMLVERVGADLWTMSNVLDQLASLAAAKQVQKISEDMVRQFTVTSYDENIFHLTDALAQKNARVALELMLDQLESGAHPLYILTMLIRQFRMLAQLAGPDGERLTPADIGAHPFAVQKARETMQHFSLDDILRVYKELERIDAKLKTGEKDAETLFSRFVYSVAGN